MARDGNGLRPISSGGAEPDGLRAAASSRRSTGRTQDIDRHVGARIRERRIMLGLTQQQLADLIGVTYQQASTAFRPAVCSRSRRCSAFRSTTFSMGSSRRANGGSVPASACVSSWLAISLRYPTNGTKRR